MNGAKTTAEIDTIIEAKGQTEAVAEYITAKAEIDKSFLWTDKGIFQFLIIKTLDGCSTKEMLEAYEGEELAQKYIKRFKVYKKLYQAAPGMFAVICEKYKIGFPVSVEEHKSSGVSASTGVAAMLTATPVEEEEVSVAGASETPEST